MGVRRRRPYAFGGRKVCRAPGPSGPRCGAGTQSQRAGTRCTSPPTAHLTSGMGMVFSPACGWLLHAGTSGISPDVPTTVRATHLAIGPATQPPANLGLARDGPSTPDRRPQSTRYPVTAAFRGATCTRLLKCATTADCVRAVVVMTEAPRLICTEQE